MEKALFDNTEFTERQESLMEGYESTDIEFKSGFGRGTKYQINEAYEHTTLEKVASKVASKVATSSTRKSAERVRQDIIDVCDDYISLEEIATKVGKGIRYLKNKIMPQMVSEGLLDRQFPDTPNHPYQKYKAKK